MHIIIDEEIYKDVSDYRVKFSTTFIEVSFNGNQCLLITNAANVTSINGSAVSLVLSTLYAALIDGTTYEFQFYNTTASFADSTNRRYVTDAMLTIIGATSGTNTGDETVPRIAALLHGATLNTGPADTDEVFTYRTSAGLLLRTLYSDVKAYFKTFFDGIYTTAAAVASAYQALTAKDATGGYVGLTLFKINFKNAANTFTSFFTNSNTAARTYTFQDRNGTIADDTDLAAKAANVLTGYVSGAGTILATDTILQAIQKLNGNDATNANLTGEVTSVGNATTITNAAVIAKVLTGYTSGAGTITASDTILSAIQKLNGNQATNANLTGPITSVGNATAVAAQTGTGSTFVMNTSPTLVTPILGNAKATSINTGTTGDGTILAYAINALSLVSNNHALTVGNEASGNNIALGLYGSVVAIQARNNGTFQSMYIQPVGGALVMGDGGITGQRYFAVHNSGTGTGDYATIEVRNGSAGTDALRLHMFGINWPGSGMNKTNYGVVQVGTGVAGLSIGTQGAAPIEIWTTNVQRIVISSGGDLTSNKKIISTGGGLGYGAGAGGTVAQATSKTTGVTLSKLCGDITLNAASLAAATIVSFVLTNTFIEATDLLLIQHVSGGTVGAYTVTANCAAGTATIYLRNNTAGALAEALVLKFSLRKGATT